MDLHTSATRTAVTAMVAKAQELDVNGVAVAALNATAPEPMFISIEARCTNNSLEEDRQNLLAIALAKVAQCLRTGLNSGQEAIEGENQWAGGVIDQELLSEANTQLVCAFSGGTEEQDVEIANVGLRIARADIQVNIASRFLARMLFG